VLVGGEGKSVRKLRGEVVELLESQYIFGLAVGGGRLVCLPQHWPIGRESDLVILVQVLDCSILMSWLDRTRYLNSALSNLKVILKLG
jgi:hypothetical protein